jgi:hypothetical protein
VRQVEGLVEEDAHHTRGEADMISPRVPDVTDVDPRDVARFAEDYASAVVAT